MATGVTDNARQWIQVTLGIDTATSTRDKKACTPSHPQFSPSWTGFADREALRRQLEAQSRALEEQSRQLAKLDDEVSNLTKMLRRRSPEQAAGTRKPETSAPAGT